MTAPTPRHLLIAGCAGLLGLALACAGREAADARPPAEPPQAELAQAAEPKPAPAHAPRREVTLFGVVATPGTPSVDPRLEEVGMVPQLRKFLGECSECGVKLLGSETRERLAADEAVTLDLEQGYSATTRLLDARPDDNGKVRLELTLVEAGRPQFTTRVTTPLEQPFFCDKQLADGRRLLLMVGAR